MNRWLPDPTVMMGVLNRLNTSQKAWVWAAITSGAGTDSVTWSYTWGSDSLILGESFICAVPLETQAGTTNNPGIGSPFAGNPEVYPVYRIGPPPGIEETAKPGLSVSELPTIVRRILLLPSSPLTSHCSLFSIDGRKVMDLKQNANDLGKLAPGVYFVREAQAQAYAQTARKIVLTK